MASNPSHGSSTQTIAIDGMSGDTCVQKVQSAINGVHGVSTESVEVGTATIEGDATACKAACDAINKAGYKASMSGNAQGTDSRNASNANSANGKPSGVNSPGANTSGGYPASGNQPNQGNSASHASQSTDGSSGKKNASK